MIASARVLAHALGLLLLALGALAGLALAVFSLQAGDRDLSLTALARHLELPALRDEISGWLGGLEGGSDVAWWTVLGGVVAIAAGALLVAGVLLPRRRRLVTLEHTELGRLAARRRAFRHRLEHAAADGDATAARIRLRGRRGDRVEVDATHPRGVEPDTVAAQTTEAIAAELPDEAPEPQVEVRAGGKGERVL